MNRIRNGSVVKYNKIAVILIAIMIGFPIVPGFKTEAQASSGAAFLGGMVAAHVVGGAIRRDRIRTAAAVETANQPRQAAPAAAAPQTREQKLQQLDKLAAGGYVTPAEYKSRKKAIVDGN